MSDEQILPLFGFTHCTILMVIVVLNAIILLLPKWMASAKAVSHVALALAMFMIIQEIADRTGHHVLRDVSLTQILPLHLCGVAVFLVPVMLVSQSYTLFEVLYFWGIGGASVSLLTPDLAFPFPHPLTITFFTSHAFIITGVLYAMIYYGFRPRASSLLKAIIMTVAYAAAVAPVNILLGTNYLYICEKPRGFSVLDFLGPWPWYLPGMAAIALAVFALLYTPFPLLHRFFANHRTGDSQETAE
ncbi:MAG TPA: TIGR02206 family membrane protein [Candidatus Hydrogenedentes bacterium]|nr:TIGR02206 family membrane protein [Candidatus Hydrogenedentota bacterium]